jgi:transcriptional regulator of NAD metabolism
MQFLFAARAFHNEKLQHLRTRIHELKISRTGLIIKEGFNLFRIAKLLQELATAKLAELREMLFTHAIDQQLQDGNLKGVITLGSKGTFTPAALPPRVAHKLIYS